MGIRFYCRFALSNLRKNAQMVVPFVLTAILAVVMFYNCMNLAQSDATGTGNLEIILNVASIFLGFFSVGFLFYTNSFLTKRRKKEMGLYNILGLEKKHISRIILIENMMMAVAGGGAD